jgi:hypothetical protein
MLVLRQQQDEMNSVTANEVCRVALTDAATIAPENSSAGMCTVASLQDEFGHFLNTVI